MLSQNFVVLYRIHNCIEYILPYFEFCLEKRCKILTVIWIDPYAILQSDKSDIAHDRTETISYPSAALGNIEYNHAPSFVPFPFLITESDLGLLKRKCLTSCVGQA